MEVAHATTLASVDRLPSSTAAVLKDVFVLVADCSVHKLRHIWKLERGFSVLVPEGLHRDLYIYRRAEFYEVSPEVREPQPEGGALLDEERDVAVHLDELERFNGCVVAERAGVELRGAVVGEGAGCLRRCIYEEERRACEVEVGELESYVFCDRAQISICDRDRPTSDFVRGTKRREYVS